MAAGTWYLVEQCGQTVHGTACEEKLHLRAPKREAMCEQEKTNPIGSKCPGAAAGCRRGKNVESGCLSKWCLSLLSCITCNAMCRDLPLDGGLEAFFCDMAQGAPAPAVTSVEFRIGDPSCICISALHLRDRCSASGFVNVIRKQLTTEAIHTAIS
jgi:hypothetical protein